MKSDLSNVKRQLKIEVGAGYIFDENTVAKAYHNVNVLPIYPEIQIQGHYNLCFEPACLPIGCYCYIICKRIAKQPFNCFVYE